MLDKGEINMDLEEKKKVISYTLKLDVNEAKALQKVLREVIENEGIRIKFPEEMKVVDEINSLLYCNIVD